MESKIHKRGTEEWRDSTGTRESYLCNRYRRTQSEWRPSSSDMIPICRREIGRGYLKKTVRGKRIAGTRRRKRIVQTPVWPEWVGSGTRGPAKRLEIVETILPPWETVLFSNRAEEGAPKLKARSPGDFFVQLAAVFRRDRTTRSF